ncbi:MAG: serine hydrolase [Phycisphaerales bacterium]|nr:serine hydrolase [Phycisphaerales bacterium]
MHTRLRRTAVTAVARALLAAAAFMSAGPARAQPADAPAPAAEPAAPAIPDTPAGSQLRWALEALSGGELGDLDARFTPEFFKQVPARQLETTLKQVHSVLLKGKPVRLAGIRDGASPLKLTADLVAEADQTKFTLFVNVEEASGKMNGLLIRPTASEAPKLANYQELDAELTKLPGLVNCGVFRITGPAEEPAITLIHGLNADSRLALGSAFKLYILGTLAELVEAGDAAWDEELEIKEEYKSLPSGDMQLQPAGAKFPLSHFADKMISISDNTATDHLLHRAGRESVEAYMARLHNQPELNRPFLSTLEMFKVKLSDDRGLAARYAAADEKARREMITPGGEVAKAVPNILLAAAWKKPVEVRRVEWFASPEELARLMADLRRKEARPGMGPMGHAMRLNPGLGLNREVWPGVAFKGGSEPGVVSGTWLLKRSDGAEFVVTVSWTNPENLVDEARWVGLCTAAVNLTAGAARE